MRVEPKRLGDWLPPSCSPDYLLRPGSAFTHGLLRAAQICTVCLFIASGHFHKTTTTTRSAGQSSVALSRLTEMIDDSRRRAYLPRPLCQSCSFLLPVHRRWGERGSISSNDDLPRQPLTRVPGLFTSAICWGRNARNGMTKGIDQCSCRVHPCRRGAARFYLDRAGGRFTIGLIFAVGNPAA